MQRLAKACQKHIKEDPVVDSGDYLDSNIFMGLLYPGREDKDKGPNVRKATEQENDIVVVTDKSTTTYDTLKGIKMSSSARNLILWETRMEKPFQVGKGQSDGRYSL